MRISEGRSAAHDAETAVAEATHAWGSAPDILFTFSSTKQDPAGVYEALRRRFPDTQIVGCTTAGEHLAGQHSQGGLVLTGLSNDDFSWHTATLSGLAELSEAGVKTTVSELLARAGYDPIESDPSDYVCLIFLDGLCGVEERVGALVADALNGVPMAGGSAGDDLAFERTWVMTPAGPRSDAALLVLARSHGAPIQIVKHQHFVETERQVAVTRAVGRTVYELDGYPALQTYARALGVPPEAVTTDLSFLNPVTFACGGDLYVRSVQSIGDDGSLVFYCAVEEGMVLDIGDHEEMTAALIRDFEALAHPVEFMLGFNCILRSLEATGAGLHDALGDALLEHCEHMVGFDTYGEQLRGLHINQTLVAVGFGRAA